MLLDLAKSLLIALAATVGCVVLGLWLWGIA